MNRHVFKLRKLHIASNAFIHRHSHITITRPIYTIRVAGLAALLALGIGITGSAGAVPREGPYSLDNLTFQPIALDSVATYTASPSSSSSPDNGLSFGIYNSDATITMVQNGKTIYQHSLTGEPFNFDFEHPGCRCSYGYVNLTSSSAVAITVENTGIGVLYFNYNLFSSSINRAIAALIMYPAQWAVNFCTWKYTFKWRHVVYGQSTDL